MPVSVYGSSSDRFPYGAKVILTHDNKSPFPEFYLSGRSISGNSIKLTCYDRVMFSDVYPDLTDITDSENNVVLSLLGNKITGLCGFTVEWGEFINMNFARIPEEKLREKTVRQILSELSKAACGYFAMGSASLRFIPFAAEPSDSVGTISEYTAVHYGFSKQCQAVRMSNGSEIYENGPVSDAYHTLKIETIYASAELARAVAAARSGVYTSWSCDKARIDFYPFSGDTVKLGDEKLVVNNLKMDITPEGKFISTGRNHVFENEYCTRTQRELNERIKLGTVNGNTKLDRDGIKLIFKNENASEEYGFTTDTGGMTTYSGVMNDGVMPSKIIKSGDNERTVMYGDTKYRLTWDKAEDGSKTNIRYEKAVE